MLTVHSHRQTLPDQRSNRSIARVEGLPGGPGPIGPNRFEAQRADSSLSQPDRTADPSGLWRNSDGLVPGPSEDLLPWLLELLAPLGRKTLASSGPCCVSDWLTFHLQIVQFALAHASGYKMRAIGFCPFTFVLAVTLARLPSLLRFD